MRTPLLISLLVALLAALSFAPWTLADDDPAVAEVLRRLERIEERLDRIERKLDALVAPSRVGPLEPEIEITVRVAVVLDVDSLRIAPRFAGGGPADSSVDVAVDARVTLLRAPAPVRDLSLTIFPSGPESGGWPWTACLYGDENDEWAVGTERTISFRRTMVSYLGHEGLRFRSIRDALTGSRLFLYVDSYRLTDGTVWDDSHDHWVTRLSELPPGMSFEAVKKLLPPADDDVAVQAFPGQPVLRCWRVSPRWMVQVRFDAEGLTGTPALLPIAPPAK